MTSGGRVAVIPARGGSRRLPRKNVMPVRGRPMIAWTVAAAVDSSVFERILVSTDDAEIAAAADLDGATVLDRPPELAGDDVPLVSVLHHVLSKDSMGATAACLLMPNCPFRTADDIGASARRFEQAGVSSLMSVVAYDWRRPDWALTMADDRQVAFAYRDLAPTPTERSPRLVCPSGAIRWVAVDRFLANPRFYAEDTEGFELPWHRALDIDEPSDLVWSDLITLALDQGMSLGEVT